MSTAAAGPQRLLTPGNLATSPEYYGRFVYDWMDNFLVATRPASIGAQRNTAFGFASVQARDALIAQAIDTFKKWCAIHGRTYATRAGDFLSQGDKLHVCFPPGGDPVAAMGVDDWRRDDGVRGVNFEHWYGDTLVQSIATEKRRIADREREAREAPMLRAELELQAAAEAELKRVRAAKADADRAAIARGLVSPIVPGCAAFERQSNQLSARLSIGMTFDEYRRQVGDLAVAYEDCTSARPAPDSDRAMVHKRAFSTWRLMYDLWALAESQCAAPGCGAAWPRIALSSGKAQAIYNRYPGFEPMVPDTLVNSLVAGVPRFKGP